MDGSATLLVARVEVSANAELCNSNVRLHAANPGYLLVVNKHGQLFEVHPGGDDTPGTVVGKFELYLATGGDEQPPPVHRAWRCFECQDDGIIFVHAASCNMLFVQLPAVVGECSGAFLFGKHADEVTCMARSPACLASGAADGSVKLWDAETGKQLDVHQPQHAARVTALEFVGPLMVAVGNQEGVVTMMDTSERRLMPVQRFAVDVGPVSCMAASLSFDTQRDVAVASAPRGPDGGGVVRGPLGLPWRTYPFNVDASEAGRTDVLLAVASDSGWLHIYQPLTVGEYAWKKLYSGSLRGRSSLAFSSDGSYLMVVTGSDFSSSVMVMSTRDWTTVHQVDYPGMLVGGGFLPPGSELAVFKDTLQPAVRLTMYTCPSDGMPLKLQCKLPFLSRDSKGSPSDLDASQTYLDALGGLATTQAHIPGGFRQANPLPRPILSPARHPVVPSAIASANKTATARPSGQTVGSSANVSTAAPTGMSATAGSGSGSGSGMRMGEAAAMDAEAGVGGRGAVQRMAFKPSTLPAGRSWLTDQAPPPVDLSDVEPLVQARAQPAATSLEQPVSADGPQWISFPEAGGQEPAHVEATDAAGPGEADAHIDVDWLARDMEETHGLGSSWAIEMGGDSALDMGRGRQGPRGNGQARQRYAGGTGDSMTQDDDGPRARGGDTSRLQGSTDDKPLEDVRATQGAESLRHGGGVGSQLAIGPEQRAEQMLQGRAGGAGQGGSWEQGAGQSGVQGGGHVEEVEDQPRAMPSHVALAAARRATADSGIAAASQRALPQPHQQHHQPQPHQHHEYQPHQRQPQQPYQQQSQPQVIGPEESVSWQVAPGATLRSDANGQSIGSELDKHEQTSRTGDTAFMPRPQSAASVTQPFRQPTDTGPERVSAAPPRHSRNDNRWVADASHGADAPSGQGSPASVSAGRQRPCDSTSRDAETAVDQQRHHQFEQAAFFGSQLVQLAATGEAGGEPQAHSNEQAAEGERYTTGEGYGDMEADQTYQTADFVSSVAPWEVNQGSGGPAGVSAAERGGRPVGAARRGAANLKNEQGPGVTAARGSPGPAVTTYGLRGSNRRARGVPAGGTAPHPTHTQTPERAHPSLNPLGAPNPEVVSQPPPPPTRSPYRGYKPNMAILLKELRARSQAGRKKPTAGVGGGGAVVEGGSAAPAVDVGQVSDQLAAVQLQPRQQQQLSQLPAQSQGSPERWPAPASIAASMMMASPNMMSPTSQGRARPGRGFQDAELERPQLNTTLGILGRMDALAQGEPAPAAPLAPHQQAEAVRCAAALASNIPPGVRLYTNLQAIGATVFAPKPTKQLHPNWVASRSAKPEISSLWSAQEQQKEVCGTRGVAQYVRPNPEAVSLAVLEGI